MDKVVECSIKEVQKILDKSKSQISRMISVLRDVLDKPKPKIITMDEFCEYYGL